MVVRIVYSLLFCYEWVVLWPPLGTKVAEMVCSFCVVLPPRVDWWSFLTCLRYYFRWHVIYFIMSIFYGWQHWFHVLVSDYCYGFLSLGHTFLLRSWSLFYGGFYLGLMPEAAYPGMFEHKRRKRCGPLCLRSGVNLLFVWFKSYLLISFMIFSSGLTNIAKTIVGF